MLWPSSVPGLLTAVAVMASLCPSFVLSWLAFDATSDTQPDVHSHCYKAHKHFSCFNNSEVITKLQKDMNTMKFFCGEVCNTGPKGPERKAKQGKYVRSIKKKIDCPNLLHSTLFDEGLIYHHDCTTSNPPPHLCEVPKDIMMMYTYEGRVSIIEEYFYEYTSLPFNENRKKQIEENGGIDQESFWTNERIDAMRTNFAKGTMEGLYRKESVDMISEHLDKYMEKQVTNGKVLVIGTEMPWLEAMLLEKGTKQIFTLEYKDYEDKGTEYPGIVLITPAKLAEMAKGGKFDKEEDKFDAVVTFSSIEHSGLGRYGDKLNPWGDLVTMAKSWCLTKKGGRALVGVPNTKTDSVNFNGGRMYGELSLAHLLANWKQVATNDPFLLHRGTPEFDGLEDKKDWFSHGIYILEK